VPLTCLLLPPGVRGPQVEYHCAVSMLGNAFGCANYLKYIIDELGEAVGRGCSRGRSRDVHLVGGGRRSPLLSRGFLRDGVGVGFLQL
jgi:hypothetical protein